MKSIRNVLKLGDSSQFALIAMSFVLFLAKSWENSIHSVDSALHARLALEVTKGGWLPVLPMPSFGADDPRPFFNDQPFTLFYLVGHWMRFWGASAWSARFIPGLFGVANIYLLLQIGKKKFSKNIGFGAAFVLMVTPMFLQSSARFQLDPSMTFFVLLSYFWWLEKKYLKSGFAVGAAVIFKAPTGLLLFPAVLLHFLLFNRKFFWVTFSRLAGAVAVSIGVIGFFWVMVNHLSGLDLFLDYFNRQVLGTSIHGRFEGRHYNPFFFFRVFAQQSWIWILLSICALLRFILKKNSFGRWSESARSNEALTLAFCMATVLVVVVSGVRFQAGNYFMPAFPFVSILFATWIDFVFQRFWPTIRKVTQVVAPLSAFSMVIFPISTGPEMLPAFRHFAPYIQAAGSCADSVMFIDSESSLYGGRNAYFCQIAFYTGRKVHQVSCEEALGKIKEKKPAWILLNGNAASRCLHDEALPQYVSRIKFGSQHLWGIYPQGEQEWDLTPLYRELTPPVDCEPIELIDTPWIKFK